MRLSVSVIRPRVLCQNFIIVHFIKCNILWSTVSELQVAHSYRSRIYDNWSRRCEHKRHMEERLREHEEARPQILATPFTETCMSSGSGLILSEISVMLSTFRAHGEMKTV